MSALLDPTFEYVFRIIDSRRSKALLSVNVENILTCWEIGALLSPRIHAGSWNASIVGDLADYIKRCDPAIKGFSKSNLYQMASFYDKFSADDFLSLATQSAVKIPELENIFQPVAGKCGRTAANADIFQPVAEIRPPDIIFLTTYTNLVLIGNFCDNPREMLFYILYAHRERLKKRELSSCLAQNTYCTLLGGDKDNYSRRLKELYPAAPVMIKDQALLEYLSLPPKHRESSQRKGIVSHIRDFILEIGKDFLFMDQEYTLPVGGEDFRSDLLFFHRGLQCLVAIELKTRRFRPSDLGQLEFYLEALDRDVKRENENPSIGIILCKEANRVVVEYAMSRTMSPVMVAQYKRLLIPKEVLERTFSDYLALDVQSTNPRLTPGENDMQQRIGTTTVKKGTSK